MKRSVFLLATMVACAPLAACDFGTIQSPGSVANRTVLDEQIAVSVELAYKAARVAVETGVDAGLIKGATAAKVALADNRAFAAVQFVRTAYRAGNAASYSAAATEAQKAVGALLSAIKG